jgi:orotate phosphoribosyltransferase
VCGWAKMSSGSPKHTVPRIREYSTHRSAHEALISPGEPFGLRPHGPQPTGDPRHLHPHPALLTGHFVLRSGLHSGHYFQCAQVCQRMDAVERLAELLLAKIRAAGWEFTTVLAPAMGGLVIGQEVARQAKARYIFCEKENNVLVLRRGFTLAPGEPVLVVEDVVTRGGRVNECLEIVRRPAARRPGSPCWSTAARGRPASTCRSSRSSSSASPPTRRPGAGLAGCAPGEQAGQLRRARLLRHDDVRSGSPGSTRGGGCGPGAGAPWRPPGPRPGAVDLDDDGAEGRSVGEVRSLSSTLVTTRPVDPRVDAEVPADVVGKLADLDSGHELVRLLLLLPEDDLDRHVGLPSREDVEHRRRARAPSRRWSGAGRPGSRPALPFTERITSRRLMPAFSAGPSAVRSFVTMTPLASLERWTARRSRASPARRRRPEAARHGAGLDQALHDRWPPC